MFQALSVSDITRDIGLATAPAFLLGAVAGMLSLLVAQFNRISDQIRELNAGRGERQQTRLTRTKKRMRRMRLAIDLCAHSGIATGWMVVLVFVDALFGFQNSCAIALMFIAAMVLFSAALLLLLLETRVAMIDLEHTEPVDSKR